jgi:hypothetical protein
MRVDLRVLNASRHARRADSAEIRIPEASIRSACVPCDAWGVSDEIDISSIEISAGVIGGIERDGGRNMRPFICLHTQRVAVFPSAYRSRYR